MFEVELSAGFFLFGILFDRVIFPRFIVPKLRERFSTPEKHKGGRPKGSKNKAKEAQHESN